VDIAALSIGMKQANLQQAASISVLKMAMDTAQNNSESLQKIMEQAVEPHLGTKLNIID